MLGVVIGGVGVASIVTGTILGIASKAPLDESNAAGGCNQDTDLCKSQLGIELRDEALALAHGSTATFVIGASCLVAGTIVFASAPRSDARSHVSYRVELQPRIGGGGVVLKGEY